MLRVLYLPLNDASSVQQSTYDGFINVGVDLEICDFHNVWLKTKNKQSVALDFLDKVRKFKPHLIHMQLQFTGLISASTLREARDICPNVVITNWSGDIRNVAIPDFVAVSSALDYSLISSTGQLELYRQAGCDNIRYWQIGYDPKINYPLRKNKFKYDVAFIANNYGNTFPDGKIRSQAAECLKTTYGDRFGLFGAGYAGNVHPIEPKNMNGIYNDSICALSISNYNSVSHYFSDRLLYCVASGRPTIAWRFPGCDSYFVDGAEVLFVDNNHQMLDAVNYLKNNPDKAYHIGRNGALKAQQEHTFDSRIIELLDLTNLLHLV